VSGFVRLAHRHPFWLVPLVAAVTATGFLFLPTSPSRAVGPGNDSCSSPVPLTSGTVIQADSSQAASNYKATTVTDTSTVIVPSAGPSLVYTLTLTDAQSATVFVIAPFNVSVWAASNSPANPTTPCGEAQSVTFASAQNAIVVLPFFPSGTKATVWSIVIAGWTPNDRGVMKIATVMPSSACQFACEALPIGIAGGDAAGVQSSIGAAQGAIASLQPKFTHWSFAESSTRDGLREFITLSSPVTQDVTITYNLDPSSPGFAGTNPIAKTVHLIAGQRATVSAADGTTGGAGPNLDFSFTVDGMSSFSAAAVLYVNRDVGLGVVGNGFTDIQGESN
jgi:hypothetical protein